MLMKKIALMLAEIVLLSLLTGCGIYKCDRCGKTFFGDAYYDAFRLDDYLCEDCAMAYYAPFPYKSYIKEAESNIQLFSGELSLEKGVYAAMALIVVSVVFMIIKNHFLIHSRPKTNSHMYDSGPVTDDDYKLFVRNDADVPAYNKSPEVVEGRYMADISFNEQKLSQSSEVDDYKTRVEKLKIAKESGLISGEEYEKKVAEMINEI